VTDPQTDPREFMESNQALWDEWVDINARSEFYGLEEFRRGGTKLRPYELEEVGDVRGKTLLHLQCHFGMDTLSWARAGAVVTGADFSERGIEVARSLSAELGIEAAFVHADLYDLPDVLEGHFDIVYASRGVLNWLPDLTRWGQVAAHFVKPGGVFYVTEAHPVLHVFDDELNEPYLRLRYPYWTPIEPLAFENVGSYADRTQPVTVPMEYDWNHSLGEIVTAVADAGLRIEFLHEFDFLEWPMPPLTEEGEHGLHRLPPGKFGPGELPLFFSLRATKPA
jgi:SAM-dependent methyltransferase